MSRNFQPITIFQWDMDGVFIRSWSSAKLAASELRLNYWNLLKTLAGKQRSFAGSQWTRTPESPGVYWKYKIAPKFMPKTYYRWDINGNLLETIPRIMKSPYAPISGRIRDVICRFDGLMGPTVWTHTPEFPAEAIKARVKARMAGKNTDYRRKMTPELREAILASNESTKELALRLGISVMMVGRVRHHVGKPGKLPGQDKATKLTKAQREEIGYSDDPPAYLSIKYKVPVDYIYRIQSGYFSKRRGC